MADTSPLPPPSGYPGLLPMDGVYPGFYRGLVVQNDDRPTKEGGKASPPTADDKGPFGRVRVSVEQVYGTEFKVDDLPWAEVCYPFGGGPTGPDQLLSGILFVPRIGTSVWVGFEHGDPQRPIVVGQWFGRKDDKVEIPREAIDRSRAPYETEQKRTKVVYPDIFIIKPPGAVADKEQLAMCIRFVGDERVDIILNGGTWIELDSKGSPSEADPLLLGPMIRVHSANKVVVSSDSADPAAILLLARNGGIRLDAKTQVITACRSGGIGEEAGADPVAVRAKIAAAAAAGLPFPKLSIPEAIALGTVPGGAGDITRGATSNILDNATGTQIVHQARTLRGNGSVAGAYVHPE